MARFEGWHQRRPPAVRFGSFVSFRVWRSVQPQNCAGHTFGSFEDLGRQPTDFGPRGTPCCPGANCGREMLASSDEGGLYDYELTSEGFAFCVFCKTRIREVDEVDEDNEE